MMISLTRASWRRALNSAVFIGIFATAVRVGANLVLLPILLTKLPTEELALWWQFQAIGNFANLADFGFGGVIARVYSYLWAGAEDFDAEGLRPPPQSQEPNLPRIRQVSATVRLFYWRLAIAATVVLGLVGTFLLLKPVAAVAAPRLAWLAWSGYFLTLGYTLGTSRWLLACQGLNRMKEIQAAFLWSGLVYVGCAAALLLSGWGLLALVVANAIRGVILREYCRTVYYRFVPKLSTPDPRPDKEILKRLWPNASKFGMVTIGAMLLGNGSVIIAGHFLEPAQTANFGLTMLVGNFLVNFALLWLSVKWSELTILRTQGRLQELAVLFARRLTLSLASFCVLAIFTVLCGNRLLEWKGTHAHLLETPALVFYFAYLLVQLFYVQFGTLAYTENVVPFYRISLVTGVWMILLTYVMTRACGLWGMLIAPLLAEWTYSSWFTIWRGFRGQPLTPRQFLQAALFKSL